MDKRVKGLWVGALRSGEYQQGTQSLRNQMGYCCLGVLCDLFRRDGHTKAVWQEDYSFTLGEFDAESDEFPLEYSEVLPLQVAEWAGLGAEVDPKLGNTTAAWHNDGNTKQGIEAKSFAQIADLVEAYL